MAVPESETSTDPLSIHHLVNPAQLDYFDYLLVITVDMLMSTVIVPSRELITPEKSEIALQLQD